MFWTYEEHLDLLLVKFLDNRPRLILRWAFDGEGYLRPHGHGGVADHVRSGDADPALHRVGDRRRPDIVSGRRAVRGNRRPVLSLIEGVFDLDALALSGVGVVVFVDDGDGLTVLRRRRSIGRDDPQARSRGVDIDLLLVGHSADARRRVARKTEIESVLTVLRGFEHAMGIGYLRVRLLHASAGRNPALAAVERVIHRRLLENFFRDARARPVFLVQLNALRTVDRRSVGTARRRAILLRHEHGREQKRNRKNDRSRVDRHAHGSHRPSGRIRPVTRIKR